MSEQSIKIKTLLTATFDLCKIDDVDAAARLVLLACAHDATHSASDTVSLSRAKMRAGTGLGRRKMSKALTSLEELAWCDITNKGKRKTPRLTFILDHMCAKMNCDIVFDLGSYVIQEDETDWDHEAYDLGSHVIQEGETGIKSHLGTHVIQDEKHRRPGTHHDLGPHVSQDGKSRKNDLGPHVIQDGKRKRRDLGPHVSQDLTPSRARILPPPPPINTRSGRRERAREASEEEELLQLDYRSKKVEAARQAVLTLRNGGAETLDAWILEIYGKFGRTIDINGAAGLSAILIDKFGDSKLVRTYVLERVVEHSTGEKRAQDQGFTSYLMKDAARWKREHDARQEEASKRGPARSAGKVNVEELDIDTNYERLDEETINDLFNL